MRRDFYGLFPPGRHPCGGQSQLDMPERFLLERKMGGEKKREKAKELSVDRGRDKDREREGERNAVILFIMYSHGERRMG